MTKCIPPAPAACLALLAGAIGVAACDKEPKQERSVDRRATQATGADESARRDEPARPSPGSSPDGGEADGRAARSQDRLRESVGSDAVDAVMEAHDAWVAPVRMVGAEQAAERSLTTDRTMAGYPLTADAIPLDAAERAGIAQTLVDDGAYVWDGPLIRCANATAKGLRFARGDDKVEVWLGVECRQLIWAWRQDGEVRRWGGRVTTHTADRIVGLVP